MKNNLFGEIIKGIIIGIASIMPGISGGTLAVSLGIYDKLLVAVTSIFKSIKESIKILLPYIVGMGIGIIFFSFIVERLFLFFPFHTNMLFIGLIIGCIPDIAKELRGEKISLKYAVAFLVMFFLVIVTSLSGSESDKNAVLTADPGQLVKLFFVGIIASATMVIPGVSGSMILSVMGYYIPLIEKINLFIVNFVSFNINGITECAVILLPFGAGIAIGIFLIAKIISWIFARERNTAYCAILGLIAASPLAMLFASRIDNVGFIEGVIGIIILLIGSSIVRKF